jgi:hypothetical protein
VLADMPLRDAYPLALSVGSPSGESRLVVEPSTSIPSSTDVELFVHDPMQATVVMTVGRSCAEPVVAPPLLLRCAVMSC